MKPNSLCLAVFCLSCFATYATVAKASLPACALCVNVNNASSETLLPAISGFLKSYKHTYTAGMVYYDALLLKKISVNPQNDSLQDLGKKLLSFYKVNDTSGFWNNPYKAVLNEKKAATEKSFLYNAGASLQSFVTPKTAYLSQAGSVDVTNLADGMAKFLVKRMKEELSVAFFKKFKEDLCSEKYADLKLLFPETWKTLRTIDDGIYQYSVYLNTLRQVFIKDLSDQYTNIQNVLNQQKYKDYFNNEQPVAGTILRTSFYLVNNILAGRHPGDILAGYNPEENITLCSKRSTKVCPEDIRKAEQTVQNSVAAIQLLSASLRSKSQAHYWLPVDSVRLLAEDTTTFKYYLSLVYLQANNSKANNGLENLKLQAFLKELYTHTGFNDLDQYAAFVETFADNLNDLNESIAKIKNKGKASSDYTDYCQLFNKSVSLLGFASNMIDLPCVAMDSALKQSIKLKVNQIVYVAQSSAGLYINARSANYSAAVVNAVGILDTLLTNQYDKAIRQTILKYGTFMASVAQAQSSDEVEAAIEVIALPPGSASIKKNAAFNLSLNAYLGGFWGNEYLPSNSIKKWSGTTGVCAPIGLAFNFPFNNSGIHTNCNWLNKTVNFVSEKSSLSVFVSVLDIGAFASYRLQDSTSSSLPKVTLSNIFAPGLGLVYGFPQIPVSVGYLYQFGPALREITSEAAKVNSGGLTQRWYFFVAVDIPLVNFYTRSRN